MANVNGRNSWKRNDSTATVTLPVGLAADPASTISDARYTSLVVKDAAVYRPSEVYAPVGVTSVSSVTCWPIRPWIDLRTAREVNRFRTAPYRHARHHFIDGLATNVGGRQQHRAARREPGNKTVVASIRRLVNSWIGWAVLMMR